MSKSPTVAEIVRMLHAEYHYERGHWIIVKELRVGSGHTAGADRSIDLWALHCHPSKAHKSISYEIKRSRADFLRDVKVGYRKHRGALAYSDEFFYVAPKGMINEEDLPPWAGLIELREVAQGLWKPYRINTPLPNSRLRPPWGLIVSLLRRSGQIIGG